MRFSFPDLPEQLQAFQRFCAWATKCPVVWRDTEEASTVRKANEVWGELLLRSIKSIGTDEIRHIDLEDVTPPVALDNPRQECLGGQRLLNIQLNMKSRKQSFENGQVGWYAAEQARAKIAYPFAMSFFKPVNMSFSSAPNLVNMSTMFSFDDRIEDTAAVEFFMNAVVTDADSAAIGTYIESVEISSDLKHAGGASLDASLQLDDEVIP